MGFVSTCNPDLTKEYLLVLYLFLSEIISSLGQLCCFSERKAQPLSSVSYVS